MFLLFVALVGVSVGKEPARMQGGPLGSTLFGSERFRHDEEVSDVAFTPDDKEMWAVTYETLVRWSLPEGDKLGTLPSPCPDGYMEAVAIAADGQRIAVGCSYDDIRLIDRKGRVQGTLTGSAEQLSFSADGKVLAAFRDSEVRFIDVAKNAVLERLNVDYECQWAQHGDRWAVTQVVGEEANDTGLASYGEGGELVVLTPGKGVAWRKRMPYAGPVAFSRDGKQVVVVTSERIRSLNAANGERISGRQLDLDYAHQLVATDKGWWMAADEAMARLKPGLERITTIPHTAERLVASSTGAYVVDVADARPSVFRSDGTSLVAGDGLGGRPETTVVSSKLLAAAGYQQAVVVDRASGASHTFPVEHTGLLAIAPDERHVVFGGWDRVLLVTADGKERPIAGLGELGGVDWLGFSPDSKRLWVLDSYDELVLHEIAVAEAKLRSSKKLGEGSGDGASLSPDGRSLLIPRDDGRLMLLPLE